VRLVEHTFAQLIDCRSPDDATPVPRPEASPLFTMTTAELRLCQEGPPRNPSKDLTRGLLRVQFVLALTRGPPPIKPALALHRPQKSDPPDRSPKRARPRWAINVLPVVNQRDAQHPSRQLGTWTWHPSAGAGSSADGSGPPAGEVLRTRSPPHPGPIPGPGCQPPRPRAPPTGSAAQSGPRPGGCHPEQARRRPWHRGHG